jgi:hypothetical protein
VHKVISESKEDISYTSGKSFGVQKKTMSSKDKNQWMGMGDDGEKFMDRNEQGMF